MLEQLLNHIRSHNLCKTTDKILLAVSAGIDSMAMLHLFTHAGFAVGVAHCNFQLRGAESTGDEKLVNSICRQHNIPFHVQRFDTAVYAQENGLSTQMAARELRYGFFEHLRATQGYSVIATAHHLNDSLETVLLNLTKGSGLEGLRGIPVKNGHIIRPLLFATKEMITEYAKRHELAWRDDASNAKDDYQRNFIRHKVVPRLREINPGLELTFRNTLERIEGSYQFSRFFIHDFKSKAVSVNGNILSISKEMISGSGAAAVLLWELLKDSGFNYDQCREIVEDHQTGRQFFSLSHVLTIDRQAYLITEKNITEQGWMIMIDETDNEVNGPVGKLSMAHINRADFVLRKNSLVAQLDSAKIKYPLTWRTWRAGDSFVPFGMQNNKKISDFLIDLKLSMPEKERVSVVESDGTILWVVGHRIHDDYKVSSATSSVLDVQFEGK